MRITYRKLEDEKKLQNPHNQLEIPQARYHPISISKSGYLILFTTLSPNHIQTLYTGITRDISFKKLDDITKSETCLVIANKTEASMICRIIQSLVEMYLMNDVPKI